MSLLDGDIRDLFGGAFGEFYRDGFLIKTTLVDDGAGGWTSTTEQHAIKLQVDAVDEDMGARDTGHTLADAKIFVLKAGIVVDLTTDDVLTSDGQSWAVLRTNLDPGLSHWTATCQELRIAASGDVPLTAIAWGGVAIEWGAGQPITWGP